MLPFTGIEEAEFVSRVDVGQVAPVGMECQGRLHNVDVGRFTVPVLYSGTVGSAGWGGLDRHDAVELTAVDPPAGVRHC